nr:CMD domain protein [Clavibacter michiganensis]
MTHAADVVDLLAGLAPDHPLRLIRDLRPDARANAQRSFEALLEPAEPGAFTYAERYAVAAFVARLHGSDRAAAFYADLLGDADAALVPVIAAPRARARPRDPRARTASRASPPRASRRIRGPRTPPRAAPSARASPPPSPTRTSS